MRFLVMLLAAGLTAASASARVNPKQFTLYFGGGITAPISPDSSFRDRYKSGMHGLGDVGFQMSPLIQTVLKVEYHSLSRDWEAEGLSGLSGATLQALLTGFDVRLEIGLPKMPVKPFGFAGLGIAALSYSGVSKSANGEIIPEDASKLYFNIGWGLDLKAGPSLSAFVQMSYVRVATSGESTSFTPLTVGLKF